MPPTHAVAHRIALAAIMLLLSPSTRAEVGLVSPTYIDFGEIKMGALVVVPVTLRNLTAQPMSLAGGGFNSANGFSSLGGTCSSPVPAHSQCTINYRFQPQTARDTVVNSTTLLLSAAGESVFIPLHVRGTGGESLVQVTPRSIDFGEELIGQTVEVPVMITNTHSSSVSFAGGGVSSSSFAATGNCGGQLAPGGTCSFNYRFTPGQINEVSATTGIMVAATGPNMSESYAIALRGRGRATAGRVHVAPIDLDFGDIKIGSQVMVPVITTNRTAMSMTRAGGGFNNNDNAFTAGGGSVPGCGGGMAPPGVGCASQYRFLPRERRAHQAGTLMAFSQPPSFYEKVSLNFTGTGVGTLARVWPVDIDFGNLPTGQPAEVEVTVLNTSPVPLTSFLGGNVTGHFSRTANTCTSTLAPGNACSMRYRLLSPTIDTFFALTYISYQGNGVEETTQITLGGRTGTAIFVDGFDP